VYVAADRDRMALSTPRGTATGTGVGGNLITGGCTRGVTVGGVTGGGVTLGVRAVGILRAPQHPPGEVAHAG